MLVIGLSDKVSLLKIPDEIALPRELQVSGEGKVLQRHWN